MMVWLFQDVLLSLSARDPTIVNTARVGFVKPNVLRDSVRPSRARLVLGSDPGAARKAAGPWLPSAAPRALVEWYLFGSSYDDTLRPGRIHHPKRAARLGTPVPLTGLTLWAPFQGAVEFCEVIQGLRAKPLAPGYLLPRLGR